MSDFYASGMGLGSRTAKQLNYIMRNYHATVCTLSCGVVLFC